MNEKELLNTDTEKNLGTHQRKYKEALMVISQSNLTILLSLSPFPLSRNPAGDKLSLQLTLLKLFSILISSKVLLFSTGNSAHCYVAAWIWGRMNTCKYMAESVVCLPETIITLLISCAAAAAKSLQSCPTLCDPIDGSPPGSPIPVILQARTLEWVAISFSNA